METPDDRSVDGDAGRNGDRRCDRPRSQLRDAVMNGPGQLGGECGTPSPHGWTLDTLEEYLTSKIDALEKLTAADSKAAKEAVQSALVAVEKQSTAAMAAAEKAILKSDTATEKRFDSVNEFRQTLSDQARDFLSRKEYEANHKALEEKLGVADAKISKIETQKDTKAEGISSLGALILGGFVVLSAIGNIVSVFFVLAKH